MPHSDEILTVDDMSQKFGKSKRWVYHHFFELGGGNLTVETVFVLSEKQADEFLAILKKENLELFFMKFPVEHGYIVDYTG